MNLEWYSTKLSTYYQQEYVVEIYMAISNNY